MESGGHEFCQWRYLAPGPYGVGFSQPSALLRAVLEVRFRGSSRSSRGFFDGWDEAAEVLARFDSLQEADPEVGSLVSFMEASG